MKHLFTVLTILFTVSLNAQWEYNALGTPPGQIPGIQTIGTVSNNAPGYNSIAMGRNTLAQGNNSTAMGINTEALGFASTAIGQGTTASSGVSIAMGYNTLASGGSATALGSVTIASGRASLSMGSVTTASGYASTAMGKNTLAQGEHSTSMGNNTSAISLNSTAMGSNTVANGNNSISMGSNTIAEGYSSTSMGKDSHASGYASISSGLNTKASGSNSTSMGSNTIASGHSSTSMGSGTAAIGNRSTAMGISTTAEDYGSLSIGQYNKADASPNPSSFDLTNTAFVIGNGIDDANRSDAIKVLFDGTTTIAGPVTATTFTGDGSLLTNLPNAGTDDQQLALNVNSLDLEDGGSVDLSGYLDNTDDQNISGTGIAGNMLTIGIEGGASETVDLSGYLDNTDDQNISGTGLAGNILTIGIEGGTSETVDLAPLLVNLQAQIVAQQVLIDDLNARMLIREDCKCVGANNGNGNGNGNGNRGGNVNAGNNSIQSDNPLLFENIPNPFEDTTSIRYFIPLTYSRANIVLSTTTGQILQNIKINKFGEGSIVINSQRMASAIFYYTLYVDGKKVDTKRMIVK